MLAPQRAEPAVPVEDTRSEPRPPVLVAAVAPSAQFAATAPRARCRTPPTLRGSGTPRLPAAGNSAQHCGPGLSKRFTRLKCKLVGETSLARIVPARNCAPRFSHLRLFATFFRQVRNTWRQAVSRSRQSRVDRPCARPGHPRCGRHPGVHGSDDHALPPQKSGDPQRTSPRRSAHCHALHHSRPGCARSDRGHRPGSAGLQAAGLLPSPQPGRCGARISNSSIKAERSFTSTSFAARFCCSPSSTPAARCRSFACA